MARAEIKLTLRRSFNGEKRTELYDLLHKIGATAEDDGDITVEVTQPYELNDFLILFRPLDQYFDCKLTITR